MDRGEEAILLLFCVSQGCWERKARRDCVTKPPLRSEPCGALENTVGVLSTGPREALGTIEDQNLGQGQAGKGFS